jgi:hypothetical protein
LFIVGPSVHGPICPVADGVCRRRFPAAHDGDEQRAGKEQGDAEAHNERD